MKKVQRITTLEKLIDRYIFLILERNYSDSDAVNELAPLTSKALMHQMCQKMQINVTSEKRK